MSEQKNYIFTDQVMRLVRDSGTTRGAGRGLLMALVLRCNVKKGWFCFPTYKTLAEDTLYDEATLKRAAKALVEQGLIRIQVRRNRSNVFHINLGLLF